jgi:hypothetical protein
MNDLDLIQHFRDGVPGPDRQRVLAARARLMAEVQAATDTTATTGATSPARRHRPHRSPRAMALRLGVPGAAVLAGSIAAVVLLSGGSLGGGTSTANAAIIRHAAAAFAAPPNEIFHYEIQGDGFVAEAWQLTSAPYSFLGGKGPVGSVGYASVDGTTVAFYDPTTNTITESASRKTPTTPPDNPLTDIKQQLQIGQARVLGTATIDGTRTYEVQLADKNGFDSQSLIAYVDQTSYRPIEIADPQNNGTIVHLAVVAFEYLPATPANLNLLSLTARYPTARVVSNPSDTGANTTTDTASSTASK